METQITQADLTDKIFNYEEWLTYYLNIWNRNLIARLVDVEHDKKTKEMNPEQLVAAPDGRPLPVKVRLENNKIGVQDAIDIIDNISKLLEDTGNKDVAFLNKYMSKEALKVADDMLPPKVGDACRTPDGKEGAWKDAGNGGLACIPTPEEVKVAPVEQQKNEDKQEPDQEAAA